MASKVLLFSINQCADPYPVFPLGLAYLDAALRRAGHQVDWFDVKADHEPLPALIARVQPDFIGISLRNIDDVVIKKRETYFGDLVKLCQQLRNLTKSPIIIGGSGFSIFPRPLMQLTGADFGIQGEGEVSLPALLQALELKKDPTSIAGLVFRRGDRIIINAPDRIPDGNENTSAERPGRLAQFYLQSSSMLNVQTQRGCALRCCYCTYPLIEGRSYRRRSAKSVVAELSAIERNGAKYVFIVDSVFNSSAEHISTICEEILRQKLRLRWGCFLRPSGLTPELMRLMARAGLSHIEFGTDSFCDSVLRAYGKNFRFDDIQQSSELARAEKVDYCHFLICGGPGETLETLRTSFENSLLLKDSVILALVGMRIYPGTRLFKRAVKEGRISTGDDLLHPKYYVTPDLAEDAIFRQLRQFTEISPNWIVGDPSPEYLQMAERLRAKGVVGPLWSYFAMMQRLSDAWRQRPKPEVAA